MQTPPFCLLYRIKNMKLVTIRTDLLALYEQDKEVLK